jgi:hypothetical protein
MFTVTDDDVAAAGVPGTGAGDGAGDGEDAVDTEGEAGEE